MPSMPSMPTHSAHLYLLVQRLLDRDLLPETEAAELLAEADAARRVEQSGRPEAVRPHVEKVVLFTEALVRSGVLDLADGRAVIEAARDILSEESA